MQSSNNIGDDINKKSKRNHSSDVSWVYQTGVVAWAIKPTKVSSSSWLNRWPVLLYPSWSTAMNQSGFIPSSQRTDIDSKQVEEGVDETELICIQQSRKPVSVANLGKNLVPANAALGPALDKYQGKRGRVVAYFLGQPPSGWDDHEKDPTDTNVSSTAVDTPPWRALHVDTLLPYNVTSCSEVLQACNSKIEPGPCDDDFSAHRNRLLHAMKEVSVVCQCPTLDPQVIAPYLFQQHHVSSRSSSRMELSSTPLIQQFNPMVITKSSTRKKKTINENSTPEFFDEWTVGQSLNSQKNDTQFSQGLGGGSLLTTLPRLSECMDQNHVPKIQNDSVVEENILKEEKTIQSPSLFKTSTTINVETKDSLMTPPSSNTITTTTTSSSSSSNLSDDTPITSNVSQSQLNAASVLMTLNPTSAGNCHSPKKTSTVNLSQKRKDKMLSVTFDLMDNAQIRHPDSTSDVTPSSTSVLDENDRLISLGEATNDTLLNKRRRLLSASSLSHDEDPLKISSFCSLQALTSLPVVTPNPNVLKSFKESFPESNEMNDHGMEGDVLDEMDNEGTKQLFLCTQ